MSPAAAARPKILLVSSRLREEGETLSRLMQHGADVRCASGPAEALSAAISWKPELAVLMLRHHRRDTRTTIDLLRAQPELRRLRMVLVSEPGNDLRGLSQGVDQCQSGALDVEHTVSWAAALVDRALPEGVAALSAEEAARQQALAQRLQGLGLIIHPIVSLGTGQTVAVQAQLVSADADAPDLDALQTEAQQLGRGGQWWQTIARRLQEQARRFPGCDLFLALPFQRTERLVALLEHAPWVDLLARTVIELQGTAVLVSQPPPRLQIQRLRDSGARIALGDVGAGASRLLELADFEPEFVRFSPDLLRGVAGDRRRRRVLAALLSLCRDLEALPIASAPVDPADLAIFQELGGLFLQLDSSPVEEEVPVAAMAGGMRD